VVELVYIHPPEDSSIDRLHAIPHPLALTIPHYDSQV
jgi:hypothetical protein